MNSIENLTEKYQTIKKNHINVLRNGLHLIKSFDRTIGGRVNKCIVTDMFDHKWALTDAIKSGLVVKMNQLEMLNCQQGLKELFKSNYNYNKVIDESKTEGKHYMELQQNTNVLLDKDLFFTKDEKNEIYRLFRNEVIEDVNHNKINMDKWDTIKYFANIGYNEERDYYTLKSISIRLCIGNSQTSRDQFILYNSGRHFFTHYSSFFKGKSSKINIDFENKENTKRICKIIRNNIFNKIEKPKEYIKKDETKCMFF